jgi:hypothetical protein
VPGRGEVEAGTVIREPDPEFNTQDTTQKKKKRLNTEDTEKRRTRREERERKREI